MDKMATVNKSFVEIKNGDLIVAIGGDGCAYSGVVSELNTRLKWRRKIVDNADLSSNYWRLKKLNGILV
tara:strand:- start:1123 stop:1329 length:207 start_codon:yes stop_codon:yes gene_type:complete